MGDAVRVDDVGEEVRLPVVRLDLGGQRVPHEAEAFDEGSREGGPVGVGQGGDVRAEGSGGAVDLAQVVGARDPAELAAQAVGEDGHFLADGGGRGRLPVRAREHGQIRVRVREFGEGVVEFERGGEPHVGHRALDAQGVGEVVDVLGGAQSMDHFGQAGKGGVRPDDVGRRLHPAFDEIFHGLDVVLRLGLDGGMLGYLRFAELLGNRPQVGDVGLGDDGGSREHLVLRKEDEPFHLDGDSGAVERGLGKEGGERGNGFAITAVQGPERNHGVILPRMAGTACRRRGSVRTEGGRPCGQ